MKTHSVVRRLTLVAVLLILVAAPTFARVVDSGLDVWITRGDGSTFFDFAKDPLPADFFCSGSEAFSGSVVFKGVPIATSPENVLGGSDTILQRLDHASFNKSNVAVTRLQVRALQFEGVELLHNWCGDFRVEVVLDGEQPVTEMKIHRESSKGGRFEAEVAVNAKVIFTPVGHDGEVVEVSRSVVFPPRLNSFWSERPGKGGVDRKGFVMIDTDANGKPDTYLPGTSSNFAAGWPAKPGLGGFLPNKSAQLSSGNLKVLGGCNNFDPNCHCDPAEGCNQHCLCPPGDPDPCCDPTKECDAPVE